MLGAGEPWAEKQKAMQSGKLAVLIGVPLNGNMFWRKWSDHTQRSTRGSRGERKTIMIACYQSSKSITLDVRMMLDLEEPRLDG